MRVRTKRGVHVYFYAAYQNLPESAAYVGVDLQSNGRYVVGPGSVVNGHRYQLEGMGRPRTLKLREVNQIMTWLKTLAPLEGHYSGSTKSSSSPSSNQSSHSIRQPFQNLELLYFYNYKRDISKSRNKAIFNTSIISRDSGFTAEEAEAILLQPFIADKKPSETEAARRHEGLRTIASAYSRPPRPLWGKSRQLPNVVREWFNQHDLTGVALCLDQLRAAGIRLGQRFSYSMAKQLLSVSDWVIRQTTRFFKAAREENSFAPLEPPVTPTALLQQADSTAITNAYLLGDQNQQKPQKGERLAEYFIMPDDAQLIRYLQLEVNISSDPLPLESIRSPKAYGEAIMKAFIARRPRMHDKKFLMHKLGKSWQTIKRYLRSQGGKIIHNFTERAIT